MAISFFELMDWEATADTNFALHSAFRVPSQQNVLKQRAASKMSMHL